VSCYRLTAFKVTIMWSSQRYLKYGEQLGRSESTLDAAVAQIESIGQKKPSRPAVLTLAHLAKLSGTTHIGLRGFVSRTAYMPYRRFRIRKRSGGHRHIAVPSTELNMVQTWIAQQVLAQQPVHAASHAFSPESSIVKCARQHCNARWLIKIDIADFFGSITEIQAWRVFRRLGYNRLISFEMARICTDQVPKSSKYHLKSWSASPQKYVIPSYGSPLLGRLPQGAPTSPMLSNLVMKVIDEKISHLANQYGLRFTRYSDDMTFSTIDSKFRRENATELIEQIAGILKKQGLFLNRRKTAVIPPGSRKIVLGLLVDRKYPSLTSQFKNLMKQHLFSLEKNIENHVNHRGFDSIGGMYRHVLGLINYANMVDPVYAETLKIRFDALPWPGRC